MIKPVSENAVDFTVEFTKHGLIVYVREVVTTTSMAAASKTFGWGQFKKAGKEHLGELMKRLSYKQS